VGQVDVTSGVECAVKRWNLRGRLYPTPRGVRARAELYRLRESGTVRWVAPSAGDTGGWFWVGQARTIFPAAPQG
jgi:hypothetical protein